MFIWGAERWLHLETEITKIHTKEWGIEIYHFFPPEMSQQRVNHPNYKKADIFLLHSDI